MKVFKGQGFFHKIAKSDGAYSELAVFFVLERKKSGYILLRLDKPLELPVSKILNDFPLPLLVFQGGPDDPAQLFILHTFPKMGNSKRIDRGIYAGGNLEDFQLLAKHGKLNSSNFRLFLGRWTPPLNIVEKEIEALKIGRLTVEEVFIEEEKARQYWEELYLNFLTGEQNEKQKARDEDQRPPREEKPALGRFFGSWLWKKTWILLSALMNAISLINIGVDLKLVIFRWAGFFEYMLSFFRQLSAWLFYPVAWIFDLFHVAIPMVIKDVFSRGLFL
jgi:putative AlgH/UPF0301 family transcriptional regulator